MEFFNSVLLALGKLLLGIGVWVTLMLNAFSTSVIVQHLATLPSLGAATSSPAASTASSTKAAAPGVPQAQKKTPAPLPMPAPAPSAPAQMLITNDLIAQTNTKTRASLVNILCRFGTAHTSSYISGSGLIIDSRGVILTNAHVAQFFLLQNHIAPDTASCIVRTGSPAAPAYTAALIYLPPQWVASNASQILSSQPVGTGERDYAFLYITDAAQSGAALPPSFPALALSTASPVHSDPALLAGYPAGFLDANEVQQSLYISSAVSAVQELYTFDSANHTDLVSLGGTVVSQGGSSGGAVINLASGNLVGLISSESEGTTTASRDLRAITLNYINRSLQADGKGGIAALLSGDLAKTSQDYNANVAPALTKQLLTAIDK